MASRGSLFCLLCISVFPCLPGSAQHQPVDAAEISRELLYHPPRRIEIGPQRVVFRVAKFTYHLEPSSGRWEVVREKNFAPAEPLAALKSYKSERLGAEFRFVGVANDNEGMLEIRRGTDPNLSLRPFAPLVLWKRKQLAATWLPLVKQDTPTLTEDALARDLEIAEPEVADVADDGTYLWLAIRHYAGEGWLGIGTAVRFDPATNEAKIFQSPELALSSVSHIAAAGGALWLGTHRQGEGSIFRTKGLVRFDLGTGEVRSYLPGTSPIVGNIVTALAASGNTLLVATDAGMCRMVLPKEEWTCWRIVPTVQLVAPTPVSNRSGGPPGGKLPMGSYEVRWANAAYFELITSDWIEGWVAADDLQEYKRLGFEAEPYELGNPGGGPAPIRLLAKPEGDPLAGALVYRAPLEPIGSPTAEGWQRVRARVGWIGRQNLEVVPVVKRVAP